LQAGKAQNLLLSVVQLIGGCLMKGLLGAGIVLLIAGLLMLAAPMITYTDRHKAVDLGPLEVETQTEKHVNIPQTLGIVAAAAGVALIVASRVRPRADV
jgi:uncharacterized membrane protein HdeD (DUF308 family)